MRGMGMPQQPVINLKPMRREIYSEESKGLKVFLNDGCFFTAPGASLLEIEQDGCNVYRDEDIVEEAVAGLEGNTTTAAQLKAKLSPSTAGGESPDAQPIARKPVFDTQLSAVWSNDDGSLDVLDKETGEMKKYADSDALPSGEPVIIFKARIGLLGSAWQNFFKPTPTNPNQP